MVLRRLVLGCAVAAVLATPAPARAAGVPADTTLARLQGLRLDRARVFQGTRAVVLRHPEFSAVGIGFQKAEGFPRPRPALVVGSDWDSIPPPPRPIPWQQVGRIERPRPTPYGAAAGLGAIGGFVFGFTATQLLASASDWTSGRTTAIAVTTGAVGALLGGFVAHAIFSPQPGWNAVYAAP